MHLLRRGILNKSGGGSVNVLDFYESFLEKTDLGPHATFTSIQGTDFRNRDCITISYDTTGAANDNRGNALTASPMDNGLSDIELNDNSTTVISGRLDGYNNGSIDINMDSSGTSIGLSTFLLSSKCVNAVTYTGNGTETDIPHGLDTAPSMVWIKRTNGDSWICQHKDMAIGEFKTIDGSIADGTDLTIYPSKPTDTHVRIGSSTRVNRSTFPFLMIAFAHDPSADGVIQGGSYTGTRAIQDILLDYEWDEGIQAIMSMPSSTTALTYSHRNMDSNFGIAYNLSGDHSQLSSKWERTDKSFRVTDTSGFPQYNELGTQYYYIVIRDNPA